MQIYDNKAETQNVRDRVDWYRDAIDGSFKAKIHGVLYEILASFVAINSGCPTPANLH